MHIGLLTPEYPHPSFSPSAGLGTSIKNLAKALIKEGVAVTIFVYNQESDSEFNYDGINFIVIRRVGYKFLGWYLYRKHLQRIINKEIVNDHIDLLEAPDWTGITAFMNFQVPVVVRMHGSDAYFCKLEGRKQKFKNRFFELKALRNADRLVSVSLFTAKITMEIFGIKKRIKVIPNGICLKDFSINQTTFGKKRILYFGTIIRKKGVLELAGIFNILIQKDRDLEFVLIGKDTYDIFQKKSTLELLRNKLSHSAQKALKVYKEVPYHEIKNYIESSSVIVLPSLAEALPMAWLEAMAMGKPLVTSNIGWAEEVMVDKVTGYAVNPSDHELFAARILNLIDDPEKARAMGTEARKKIKEQFSTRILVHRNIEFYKTIIDEKS